MSNKEIALNRIIAKGIDFFLVAFLWVLLKNFDAPSLGMLSGLGYILVSDGFFDGQSIGKRFIKLRVVVTRGDDKKKCTFKDSIIRNSLLAVVLFAAIPIVGWFIFLPVGILIVAIEAYFAYSDEEGKRIGDVLAGTIVEQV